MGPRPGRRAAALLTLLAVSASCVSTRLPPMSAAGAHFRPLADELVLWSEARAEEESLIAGVRLEDDPELIGYLEGIVARLNPPGMAANPMIAYRVRVIEDPALNAFSYPHGSIYLHTGLLARLENEDQLATVLGHEMTHVDRRHMLRLRRGAHNREIALIVAQVTAEVVAAGAAANAYDRGHYGKGETLELLGDLVAAVGLPLLTVAAVNGYGRSLEAEADRGGFAKLAAAGYRTAQAPRFYELLLADRDDAGATETFFFGSHPRLSERVADAEEWLRAHPDQPPAVGGEGPSGEEFARRLAPAVRADARLNLELGRLEPAQEELERVLAARPDDAEAYVLLARLKLTRAAAAPAPEVELGLRADARSALETALRLDPARAAPHRELGLLLDRDGDWQRACRELRRYLELAPDAGDAGEVAFHLDELQRVGRCPAAAAAAAILPP